MNFLEMFQHGFMQRAFLVGVLIGISSALLGVFLVLRKYSMIGDGLAHVSFASVAIALLLGASPLIVALPIVMFASFFILKLSEKAKVHGDAAIALVSSFSVALGVFITSLAKGFNVDLFSYLFGSILLIGKTDVILTIFLSVIIILSIIVFYRDLLSVTFDAEFAQVNGVPVERYNYILSLLTAMTIVIGIRIVGTMLISSLIIFPSVTALQLKRGFGQTLIASAVFSTVSVLVGIITSYTFALPTGAAIVVFSGIQFALVFLIKKRG